MNQILVIDCSGQVEEYVIEITLWQKVLRIGQCLFRTALHDRVGFLAETFELFVSQTFVVFIFERRLLIALPHLHDGMLRIVAINNGHVVTFHIMQP